MRRGDTESALKTRLVYALDDARTSLVMIDELHFMDTKRQDGQRVNDYLKELANGVAATFLYAGVELERSALFNEGQPGSITQGRTRVLQTQTSGRFTVYRMEHFKRNSAEDMLEWQQVIAAFEQKVVLYNHDYGSLAHDQWEYLYDRTRGSIGALSDLINRAAYRAVASGADRISRDVLDSTDLAVAFSPPQGQTNRGKTSALPPAATPAATPAEGAAVSGADDGTADGTADSA